MIAARLHRLSESELLKIFQEIVAKPGPLTSVDLKDIRALDRELDQREEEAQRRAA